jgi:hypothetical protein
MNFFTVATYLIVLHSVDGYEVSINPAQITNLHPTREGRPVPKTNEIITPGVRCVVGLTDGKFFSVVEDCRAIRKQLEEMKNDQSR